MIEITLITFIGIKKPQRMLGKLMHIEKNAFSFYGSKMILDCPNHFGRVPIVFGGFNSFWSDPNHFGQVQIIKISPEKSDLNLTKMGKT